MNHTPVNALFLSFCEKEFMKKKYTGLHRSAPEMGSGKNETKQTNKQTIKTGFEKRTFKSGWSLHE